MTQSDIHVVHVIHSLGPGGAEHTLIELAAAAPEHGMRLSVVSLMPLGSQNFPEQLTRLGVDVHTLDLASRWDPRGLERGRRLIAGLEADIVHTHLKHADLVGAWTSHRLGIPMVSTLHVIEHAPTTLGRGKRRLAAEVRARSAVRTIAVSEALRRWYLDSFSVDPATVVHIPNGVSRPPAPSDRAKHLVRRDLGIAPDTCMVVMIGMMLPEKGHAELLDALELLDPGIEATFVLAGDGPLRGALEERSRRLGLDHGRVVFAGYRNDVPQLLAAADLVAHPSLEDALPTALLYALAQGVPIVASDTGGIPEIVSPDVGILVDPGSVEALAGAMEGLIRKLPVPEMEEAARARFSARYEASAWAGRLRREYDDILGDVRSQAPH